MIKSLEPDDLEVYLVTSESIILLT